MFGSTKKHNFMSDSENAPVQTLGQQRVHADFNPAKNDTVDQVKNLAARMIDTVYQKGDREGLNYMSRDFDNLVDQIGLNKESEAQRCVSISKKIQLEACTLINQGGDIELIAELIETSTMYAVKANFKK